MLQCVAVCCSVVQCIAVYCSVLQCFAVCFMCCSALQCIAVCCSVLQCVAVHCSVLQSVSVEDLKFISNFLLPPVPRYAFCPLRCCILSVRCVRKNERDRNKVCVSMCVCKRERERERERNVCGLSVALQNAFWCVREKERGSECFGMRLRVRVWESVCVCGRACACSFYVAL